MFTKTTLNKMKKAQVVEMYLALQAQKINDHMAMETDYEEHIDELEVQLVNFRNNEKLREEKLQELTLENKKLKEENEELKEYAMCHPCDMECEHCGLTITEDDLSISLDCGELTCESCFDEGCSKSIKEENTELTEQYNVVVGTSNKYAEEALELKEENKKLKTPAEVKSSFEDLSSSWFGDEESWYRENFLDGMDDPDPEDIPTKDLEDCNYKQLRVVWDWLIDGKYEG